jgi:predicted dehydrogenase
MNRVLRGGMVGGGLGAFIGPVHRQAATIGGEARFVAGAFSADAEKSRLSGQALNLDGDRVYPDYRSMAAREASLSSDQRLDFVSVVTPNHSHFEVARTFLEAGFNVVCDKPMTTSLEDALRLRELVCRTRKVFVLTHSFTGYPMVKEARHLVRVGALGDLKKIIVDYSQGWLSSYMGNAPAGPIPWRLDPGRSGPAGSLGDVGTHAENLARYVTGLRIEELCAELNSFVPSSPLDTDVNILAHYEGGVRGMIQASQSLTGEENSLTLRVYGSKGGLFWDQENPNYLVLKKSGGSRIILSKGGDATSIEARQASYLPVGHPDGYIEAFANLYREGFKAIRAEIEGRPLLGFDFPTVEDGVESLVFVNTCITSSGGDAKWVRMERP